MGSNRSRSCAYNHEEPGVDIYNILAAVLGIEPAANDGDPARATGILKGR